MWLGRRARLPSAQPTTTLVAIRSRKIAHPGMAPSAEYVRYAERHDFSGDADFATTVASEVHTTLEPLTEAAPAPTIDDVLAALQPWSRGVRVSDNAIGAVGTGFAIAIDRGWAFGSIYEGRLEVAVGGYIRGGGCLATYAH